jgi:hypothetical protein
MTKQMRVVGLLAAIAVVATPGGTALGGNVKLGPVKGATYTGTVHDETITIKVAASGKTAKVSLPSAPAFCQGGSGPQRQSSKPAKVSKTGSLTAKISYSSATGPSHAPFATVTVKGNFDTFSGSKPVFDGILKTSFRAAGSESCNGQESFQATKL